MIFVDTTEATTTVEVIQEFAHVYASKRDRSEAVRLARRYATLLSPLMAVGSAHLDEGLRLFEKYPQLGGFDAALAAAAIAQGARAIVSADTDFGVIRGIHYVALHAVDELIGS